MRSSAAFVLSHHRRSTSEASGRRRVVFGFDLNVDTHQLGDGVGSVTDGDFEVGADVHDFTNGHHWCLRPPESRQPYLPT